MALPSPVNSAHLIEEREMYDQVYATGEASFTSGDRRACVEASEEFFCSRLRALARNKRVLEIGMGDGSHAIMAATAGASSVLGIDISPAAVALATARAHARGVQDIVQFKVADIESLAGTAQYDLIIDHEVFSSIDWKVVRPLLLQLLTPGGTLLGIECLNDNPIFRLNRWIGYWRGRRTGWAVRNVMPYSRVDDFAKDYKIQELRVFHCFDVLAYPLTRCLGSSWRDGVVEAVRSLDRLLLAARMLRRFAFKLVFELRKPDPALP